MKSSTILSTMGLAAARLATAAYNSECPDGKEGVPVPTALPNPGQFTSHGCYSSGGNLTKVTIKENLSSGACRIACEAKKYWVMGLHGNDCLCGNAYPAEDDMTKESKCNYPCPSYPCEACGGLGDDSYYSIFNTGINIDVPEYKEEDDTSTSSSAAASTAVATKTQTQTQPAQTSQEAAESTSAAPEEDDSKSGGGSSNVGAIAGGVVAGVVVIAGLVSVLFFMMRRKRNAEIEEEHRRNAAVNAFISGSKPPSSSDGISMTDSRLDPVLAHRRMSDGSIADNQDYSRRILRVTNA